MTRVSEQPLRPMPARGPQRKLLAALVAGCFAAPAAVSPALANPTGANIVAGSASFATNGSTLTVTNSPGAILNWGSFSIGAGETTRFNQVNSASSVLNRVIGADPSVILGTLSSNGRVFLINQSGILVGAGARIDVAGFVASTLNISNADFLAGRMKFGLDSQLPSQAGAGVVNQGEITASGTTATGGQVYLVGQNVENSGLITAPNGEILLAAGQSVKIGDTSTPGVSIEVSANETAKNIGSLVAQSGKVGLVGALVRNSGRINADQVTRGADGKIYLTAKKDVTLEATSRISANGDAGGSVSVQAEAGTAMVSGSIEAGGAAGRGGDIEALGHFVGVTGATLDASGATGGGTILVGGDAHGANASVQNAQSTYFGSDATLRVDATDTGDGGKAIVWSDGVTRAYGNISARGGANGGNGGFVETSGKGVLDFRGSVDTRAPAGATGTLLLDPKNLTVQASNPDINGDSTTGDDLATFQLLFGDFSGADSFITAGAVNSQLVANNVKLQADNNLTVAAPISGTTPGKTLTIQAGNSIFINSNISLNNANISITANDSTVNGVQSGNRDPGAAVLTMAPGAVMTAGTGNVSITMGDGSGHAGAATSGDITLSRITGNNIFVEYDGFNTNASVLMADSASVITANSLIIDLWDPLESTCRHASLSIL